MVIGIIGIVIGLLVLGAGIYYLVKEKNDPESKKIYSTAPSLAQMKELAAKKNEVIPEEEPIWPDDEDEMAKILGLG